MKVRQRFSWLLTLPSLVGVAVFYVVPILAGSVFTVWSPAAGFVGVQAIVQTLTNKMFQLGLQNTLWFLAVCVPLELFAALLISFLVHGMESRVSSGVRSLVFLPYVLPTVTVIFVLRWLFDYNGIMNWLLRVLGVQRMIWLSGAPLRIVVLLLFLWKNTGFFVTLLTARLSSVSKEQLEAAQLDGANRAQCIFAVHFPHLRPTIIFSCVMCIVQALDIFRECFLLSGSYPAQEVYTLQHYLYNCFHRGDYSSAVSALYVVLPLVACMVWLLVRGDMDEKTK